MTITATKMRPAPGDYAPYAEKYVSLIAGSDILETLKTHLKQTTTLFSGRSERDGNFRYAPDKWTVKEVLGHIIDAERVFAYRALRIARGDQTPLAGFEQDDYVRGARFGDRKLADIADEYLDVRQASLSLFSSLDENAWLRRGIASNNPVTVRAIAFIIAGHELHHRNILNERYFPAIPRA
jgi:hypothetical protein